MQVFSGYFLLQRICITLFLFFIFSCGNEVKPKHRTDPAQFKEALEKVNKYEVEKESDEITQYIAHHNWQMQRTGTGLWYMIVKKGTGAQIKSGEIAYVKYKISLLDGSVCYSSEKDGVKDFKVEGDNVESGLHEAVLLMHVGDAGKFVLPSYMANGLRGDEDKIPPMSSIVVDLELLDAK